MAALDERNAFTTHLCFHLPITRNSVDAPFVAAQRWQVEIHGVCGGEKANVQKDHLQGFFSPVCLCSYNMADGSTPANTASLLSGRCLRSRVCAPTLGRASAL